MIIAKVIGTVVSTIKHPAYNGYKLQVVQPLNLPQEPPNRTLHVVQNVRAERADGDIHATSRLLMLDYREGVQRLYGATCQHTLRPRGAGGYAIAFKRVDLLNCDGFLPMMSIPF